MAKNSKFLGVTIIKKLDTLSGILSHMFTMRMFYVESESLYFCKLFLVII